MFVGKNCGLAKRKGWTIERNVNQNISPFHSIFKKSRM